VPHDDSVSDDDSDFFIRDDDVSGGVSDILSDDDSVSDDDGVELLTKWIQATGIDGASSYKYARALVAKGFVTVESLGLVEAEEWKYFIRRIGHRRIVVAALARK
jgi:hypothetical protein